MKKQKIILLIIILLICLIAVSIVIHQNKNINKKSITIKEMSETEYDNSINALNKSHTDYANYVQECKAKLATTLTNEGVETSNQETLETMAENISKVLQARTADATATADNITKGKTAYVNGELITGNGADNTAYYESAINYNSAFYYSKINGSDGSEITLEPSFYNPNLFTLNGNILTALKDMTIKTHTTAYERNYNGQNGVTIKIYKNSNTSYSFWYEYYSQNISSSFSLSKGDTLYLTFKNSCNNITCFSMVGIVIMD